MNQANPQIQIQQQLPLAYVRGEAVIEKPEDLFIPPEALEVILESFEGPLDLLLYLIRRQKFDIAELPVHQITEQYMEYVEVMKDVNLELAAEYLVMAAMLAEIKSRILLPKLKVEEDEEEDPRAALIRQLQEYEIFKRAAEGIDNLPRNERDFFYAPVAVAENCKPVIIQPEVELKELALAFASVLKRADNFQHHHITPEVLSTRARMSAILDYLDSIDANQYIPFADFFEVTEGKSGVVVTFLAIMELVKEKLITLVQNQVFSDIHIRKSLASIE
ncbi:segregation/condensation protein A [Catenovulum sp. 2E275]|uniref:segregation and condensation protein A n=1 Tax=Catenovulum sp. 2E275 TaxID=2980497 RepID=UPI0021D10CDA|nr:ScpA family protein [Catenovulum sp. 2E275]MCU4674788.1 segregation/condensation protein A [Catenovulum sp. 2E275]